MNYVFTILTKAEVAADKWEQQRQDECDFAPWDFDEEV
jgi:hypothetical protein